jgi:predicted alpha/beta-hydrolase family hydrolase
MPGPVRGLLLTPGASAGRDQASLVAIDDALTARGIAVARIDFPYRLAGRRAPDRQPVLVETIVTAAGLLAEGAGLELGEIALGGRSMGGRMCSIAAAEGLPAAALVLISYPLHPPGKPEKLRTEHFPSLELPCLFVSGTRDAFGAPAELEAATAAIPGPVTHVWLEGGDHGLRNRDRLVVAAIEDFVSGL